MKFAEALRKTQSHAGQEAHAPFYVQYEAMKKTFRTCLPSESVFIGVIREELRIINKYVAACVEALESVRPDGELVRCSTDCGSLSTFIRWNRDGLRKIAKKFDKKIAKKFDKIVTGDCTFAHAQTQRMLETAAFCTCLLERTCDVQANLEEWALEQHNFILRGLITDAYEASAGLLDDDEPLGGGEKPVPPNAPRLPSPQIVNPPHARRSLSFPPRGRAFGTKGGRDGRKAVRHERSQGECSPKRTVRARSRCHHQS